MKQALVLSAVLVVIALAVDRAPTGNLSYHFEERRTVTWVSGLALLATGALLLRSSRARDTGGGHWFFWELSGWAFIYLALDEHFQYHERIGRLLARRLLVETYGIVNHLDDCVVMGYGFAAIAVCWLFRREVLSVKRGLAFLMAAFALLAAMAGVDGFAPDISVYRALEESLKLVAVSCFFLWALEARAGAARDPS